jgi:heptosyltransferase-2
MFLYKTFNPFEMTSTLIIKVGAAGDVVRSTVLFHAIEGDIYWITAQDNMGLFPDNVPALKGLASVEQVPGYFFEIEFDEIINLEENLETAQLAARFKTKRRTGIYLQDGQLVYSPESAGWYDLSLVSIYGEKVANELKYANTKSYQEHLYNMVGKRFAGERYLIYAGSTQQRNIKSVRVGIERRSGNTWPNKQWGGYDELAGMLTEKGYEVVFFKNMPTLREYMDDIRQCQLFISGDTLGMHVALGYEIPAIAIFNCTSPQEIYSYGLLRKVVSSLLREVYYQTGCRQDVIDSVKVEDILEKVEEWEYSLSGIEKH